MNKRILNRLYILSVLIVTIQNVHSQSKWTIISERLLFNNPPFKACHASTITETKNGEIVVACFGGAYEGNKDVVIWTGKILPDGSVIPKQAADGVVNDTLRYPCWNPVLFTKKNGALILFYKVGPNPRTWQGLYKVSNDQGQTWSNATHLPNGILGPIKNKPVQLKDGTILCPSSVEYTDEHWKAFIEKTDESLTDWTSIPVDTASKFDVIQPSILLYGNKKLQILCRSKQGNVVQSRSNDNGKSWSALSKTQLLNPNSGTDAVTLKNGKQLIVYNPDVPGKEWFNNRANLKVAVSEDGEKWQDILTLEHGTTEEFSYPAIIQTSDGLIHITYTFNRSNIKHVVVKEQVKSKN
ncbi:sialidase family protein [Pinibacter aurantiacus]|uniref:Exo-alpha-sialidase n=1 Tax=Pinibacter aurantiacus TaxID=2851599 RepID=A0A9E2S7H8_9BACT|nr:sialidase family protein [Pinibacter aurantiacus]MBV4355929.1 exo-alpha-sialidase [Pinibacter aurantiacus]